MLTPHSQRTWTWVKVHGIKHLMRYSQSLQDQLVLCSRLSSPYHSFEGWTLMGTEGAFLTPSAQYSRTQCSPDILEHWKEPWAFLSSLSKASPALLPCPFPPLFWSLPLRDVFRLQTAQLHVSSVQMFACDYLEQQSRKLSPAHAWRAPLWLSWAVHRDPWP